MNLKNKFQSRRDFVRQLGVSAAALPLITGLPSLGFANHANRKQRLVFVFSPNGTIPPHFWPDQTGDKFELKTILKPLEKFKDRMLIMKGISNKVEGDGDRHMRGMSCLLTAIELFPGNIQGGSDTPAGWAKGISIDQEIKNFLQKNPETQTRFGSLEFGVQVEDRADPWTRWVYAGPNQPIAPIDDPYQMFAKMYGQLADEESLRSVLDVLVEDLQKIRSQVSLEDRRILEEHESFVRDLEQELKLAEGQKRDLQPPELIPGVRNTNDNVPELTKMQIDLLVNGFKSDMNRISTFEFTKSVGQARMKWLGIDEGHHGLSHDPDEKKDSQEKLVKINTWFCEQVAYLVQQLDQTKEPDGTGSLLDNTTVIWTNELGKGNSHTLESIPFVAIGGGLGFRMGRSLDFKRTAHNRLHIALAHAFGHQIETFGNKDLSSGGPLGDLT
jgi:hypothetical protein